MASKINYNTKAPFQTREDIPDENKVNASDMNEIKEVVNANADELDTAKEDIENLQSGQGTSNAEITSLKNRVSTLETDNTTNKQDISSLKNKTATLETDNETNKTNITNLQSNKVDKVEGKGLSTEDFTTELKEKLEGLENYNDTEIKEDISNLEAGQTEQDKQIDMLINALPTETQENEYINLKGTIPVKFKEFVVGGNSKQETRSGKNLLYVPDQTVELNGFKVTVKDGKYTVEDNRETGIFVAIVLATNFTLKAGTYTISNGRNQNYPYVNLRSNGSAVGDSTMGGGDNGVKTITIAEDIVVDTIAIYAGTNTKITEIFPQLEEGTQATDYEPYGAMPSPEYPSEIQNVEGDVNVTVANKEKTEQQTVTFPLAQRQKLMLGDYLAADGIHHVRKQIELDGTENWQQYNSRLYLYIEDAINVISSDGTPNIKSNMFIATNFNNMSSNPDNAISYNLLGNEDQHKGICFYSNKYFTDVATLKSWLSTQKQAGTPVIVEYELVQEEIEPYTPEQQEAYNQIKELTAYEEETNVYSTNSTSPIFKVTAVQSTNAMLTQMKQLILEGGN